jgi:hypothetical protein
MFQKSQKEKKRGAGKALGTIFMVIFLMGAMVISSIHHQK